jgi:hypothetical protein
MNAQEFFQSDIQIPSLPDVYYDFKDAMDNPEASFEEISVFNVSPKWTKRVKKLRGTFC